MKTDYLFLKKDTRKIKTLYSHLLNVGKISPDCYEEAAKRIRKNKVDQSIIVTGFPKGDTFETDGPIGAFVLCDLLTKYLDFHNVYLILPERMIIQIGSYIESILPEISIISVEKIETTIDFTKSTLAISIEFPGTNSKGVAHHMTGKSIENFPLDINSMWERIPLLNSSSLTIAVGDGGNEMGLGRYEEEIHNLIPYGEKCICSCIRGIATNVKSDIALLATTSNWGAFALASLLGYKFTYKKQLEWLKELNKLGIIDGVSGQTLPTVDNIEPEIEKKVIDLIFSTNIL